MISIENLKNKKISGVGRSCDLVWIAVGNIKEAVDWNNKKRLMSEYYIHIQTSFRLVKNNRIVISDRSIYQPIVGEDWSQPNVSVSNVTHFKLTSNYSIILLSEVLLNEKTIQRLG